MRRIGVLGGMSWESTAVYYRLLNQGVRDSLGGLHSASLLLDSVDFFDIVELQRSGDWQLAGQRLANAARALQDAGATAILLATNTMHKVAPLIQAALDIPLLHIADAVGQSLQGQGISRAALLGTRFTMQQDFYRRYLGEHYGIELLLPSEVQMAEVDRIIFAELCRGQIKAESREVYLDCLSQLEEQGAEAAILACTEIGLLLEDAEASMPIFDSTVLHVQQGLGWMLAQQD